MKQEQTLVMDRPETIEEVQKAVPAGIKTILFHVNDDDSVMDRLQLVLSVARACGAHIHCLHVNPIEAYTIVDAFGGTFVNEEVVRALDEQASSLRQKIETQLGKEDVTWDYEEVTGELIPRLIQRAGLADLFITGRQSRGDFGTPSITLIGDLVAELRTPMLLTGDGSSEFSPFAGAVIAWNGSHEAANAVRAAVPLLRMASRVDVVEFAENKDGGFPSTMLVEYLSRHGIEANLDLRSEPLGGIGPGLVDYSRRNGAGYIVMGGYSHSRAGEFLFGGVTRELLKQCPVALVIAH